MENEKITCPHCGREIPWDSMFCPYCGYTLYAEQKSSDPVEEKPETVVTKTRYKTKYRKKRKKDTGRIISFTVKAVLLIALILIGINVYNRYGDDVKVWFQDKINALQNKESEPVNNTDTQSEGTQPEIQEDNSVPSSTAVPSPSTDSQDDTSTQSDQAEDQNTDQNITESTE